MLINILDLRIRPLLARLLAEFSRNPDEIQMEKPNGFMIIRTVSTFDLIHFTILLAPTIFHVV
jgi:hypothetical protein